MPRQDTVDFLTAFAVGTVLGVGATLLLQPPRSARDRVTRQIKPYRKQMRKSYRHLSRGLREGSDATSEMTNELLGAGREIVGEFREELAEILDQAKVDLREIVAEQVQELGKGARKTRRRVGL